MPTKSSGGGGLQWKDLVPVLDKDRGRGLRKRPLMERFPGKKTWSQRSLRSLGMRAYQKKAPKGKDCPFSLRGSKKGKERKSVRMFVTS